MFKTHLWWRDCPKGAGKYIYCVRGEVPLLPQLAAPFSNFLAPPPAQQAPPDPRPKPPSPADPLDVGPSLFKFQQGWFFDEGAISMSQFLDEYW